MFFRSICLFFSPILFTFLSGCSPMKFSLDLESLDTIFSSNGILINEDAPFTNQSDVRLELFGFEGQEMYLTNDPTCESRGQWIPFTQTQEWVLSAVNTHVSVYVKFRNSDNDEQTSDCISDDIIHDDIPPEVDFIEHPAKETAARSSHFILGAVDEGSGVKGYYCSDKTNYRECTPRVNLTQLVEGDNQFSYFAQDHAGNSSEVLEYEWTADFTPPTVFWVQTPPSSIRQTTAQFEFSAIDEQSTDIFFECFDNKGFSISCQGIPGTNYRFYINDLVVGLHELVVNVSDRVGNISSLIHQWEVRHPYINMKQFVQVMEPQIDVLFVVDDSLSMSEEHKSLSERLDNFIDYLVDLDWRIAVTTTNPTRSKDVEASDGKLALFPHGEYYIDYTLEESLVLDYFKQTVVVPIQREGRARFEQGIRATYRAIQRSLASERSYVSRPNKEFFRNGAALAVVLISDENEYTNHIGNNPDSVIQLVRDTWGAQKTFVFHSIIVKEGDSDCLAMGGVGGQHSEGIQYAALSRQTGGVIGSVCELDYANQLEDIGDHVRSQVLSIKLDCPPVDSNDIFLQNGDGLVMTDFIYDGQKLLFSEALPTGTYSLEYSCERIP